MRERKGTGLRGFGGYCYYFPDIALFENPEVFLKPKTFAMIAIPFLLLFLGCDDSSSPMGPTPSSVTQINLVPLRVGDKWTMSVTEADVKGGIETLEITKDDSTYAGEPVYIGEITVTAPTFTSKGSVFSNYSETGRTFIRKSDQQAVYRSESIDADLVPAGSTVSRTVHIEAETRMDLTGQIPTLLTPGLSWTVLEVKTTKLLIYDDGELLDEKDSTETGTHAYTTKGIYDVTVPAGTFAAIEVDHVVAESGESFVEYFSEEAKMTIKATDTEKNGDKAVFELRAMSLAK